MTGFRLGIGGVQEREGITPDLTAMGKIIGGGLPVGALGGKAEIMDHLAPLGPVYQAGTLSGNPLAMAAGIESLRMLKDDPPYDHLESMGTKISNGILDLANVHGIPLQVPQAGSMFCLFFSEQPVTNFEQAVNGNHKNFSKLFHQLLGDGVYLPPSSYETCFISSKHQEETISVTLEKFAKAFSSL